MLRESRGLDNVVGANGGAIDREQLLANLERQHEIKRTIEKLEGGFHKSKGKGKASSPEVDGAFDDDEDEEFSSEVATKAAGLASAKKRADIKSGSQFIDAEEERVREHIEASLAANLDKLVSLSFSRTPSFLRLTLSLCSTFSEFSITNASQRSKHRPSPKQDPSLVESETLPPPSPFPRGAQRSSLLAERVCSHLWKRRRQT